MGFTEEEIILGCINKKQNCQQKLYERFYGKMLGVCMRYAADRDEAKDMLQDGFMKVFDNISKYDSKGSIEGWVRRVIVNTTIDFVRKNQKTMAIVDTNISIDDLQSAETNEDADAEELNHLSMEELLNMIQRLSPAYRTVFNLYVFEEYTHQQIADPLSISVGTSKSNLAKARLSLQRLILKLKEVTNG
jgi:RNA polymerase sigma factor (sigma-70 family)